MRGSKMRHGDGGGEGGIVVVEHPVTDARILAETTISGCAEKVPTIGNGFATPTGKPGKVAASMMGFVVVVACIGLSAGRS